MITAPLQDNLRKPLPRGRTPQRGSLLQRESACIEQETPDMRGTRETSAHDRLQRKLRIGASNGPLERAADAVADHAMSTLPNPRLGKVLPCNLQCSGPPVASADAVPASVGNVLAGSGRPIDPPLLKDMNIRFGQDFSHVRVHTGVNAEQSAREVNAHAYTLGGNIVFGSGRFMPNTHAGLRLLAHELAHVVQQDRVSDFRHTILRQSGIHGQHVSGGLGDLTADLTSPVVINRSVRLQARFGNIPGYVPFSGPPALSPFPYSWEVTDRGTGAVVVHTTTQTGTGVISYPRPGRFRITCTLRGASGSTSVTMDQDAVAEDAWLAANLSGSNLMHDTLRELVDDFRQYVIDSAAATGPSGITARFLAAVLGNEISNTDPMPVFINNQGARITEIGDVEAAINRRFAGQTVPVSEINHSVGVGQITLSTAAQLQGVIPWTEQTAGNRGPGLARIRSGFAALSPSSQENLLTRLRWPKSNIQTAADLLVRLKNRPNRYPTLTRSAFGGNARACQIIATEYNLGASNSAEHAASPSDFGKEIWSIMSDSVISHYFPNT